MRRFSILRNNFRKNSIAPYKKMQKRLRIRRFPVKKQLFLDSGLAILKFCITFIPIVFQQELTSQEKSLSWETSGKNAARKLRSTNAKKCARQCGTRTSNTRPSILCGDCGTVFPVSRHVSAVFLPVRPSDGGFSAGKGIP